VSDDIFELANSYWQDITEQEYRERNVTTITTT